ncbi:MAG: glycosyltransferase family 4 protein [Candidatus Eisenbacteria bacterium]
MRPEGRRHLVFFADCPYYAGAEAYVGMLAEAAPQGWRLSALVPEGDPGELLARRLGAAGVEVLRMRLRAWRHPALWREISALLRQLNGDRLHLNIPSVYDARLSVPAVIAKRLGYERIVSTEHLPMVPRARRRMLVKMLTSRAIDAIIVHTEWNRERLARYHHMPAGKIVVIPNGSPEAPAITPEARRELRRSLGAERDETAIAVVGRLTARKGHRFLLEALSRLEADLREAWRLWVVGTGEEREALIEQAARLGIAARVNFLGQRDDAREIIGVCDMLVLPSLLETQPLVLTEAMAAARPVVSTAIYGIPEIVADGVTGCLVPPAEIEPLAQSLARLIRDPDLARRLGAAGRERYEALFTLRQMAERTYRVFEGPLRRAPAGAPEMETPMGRTR